MMRKYCSNHRPTFEAGHQGFTLIELLVVIGIVLLVAAITLSAVNLTVSGDRVRGAARQVQSYLEGARDRAIVSGFGAVRRGTPGEAQAVGVRFITEQQNPYLVTSFVYVQQPEPYDSRDNNQTINILNDRRTITFPANTALAAIPEELIPPLAEIYFPSTNQWQWIVKPPSLNDPWLLTSDYQGIGSGPFMSLHYRIKLLAEPMPNQEPRQLGNGVVIDLRNSRIPANWRTPTGFSNRIDLMFDARGTVTGITASLGMIEFVITDRQDALLNAPLSSSFWQPGTRYSLGQAVSPSTGRTGFIYQATAITGSGTSGPGPGDPAWPTTAGATVTDNEVTWTCLISPDGNSSAKRERLVVSLMPQTGATAVHPVYVSRGNEDADPFRYAETGEVARQ
jgi:prepilin-type N-terminal cleavage/methylation domain-containing protein